ncbi:MAG: DMT family transporter [Parvularculales bacterium]
MDTKISSVAPSANLSPYLYGMIAIVCGALMNATVKGLSACASIILITSWRYALGAVIALLAYACFRPTLPGWNAVPFHLLRGAIQITTAVTFFWAISRIPLATATALSFTGVLMIAPVARIILKEPMKPIVIGATFVGFLGALLIIIGEARLFDENATHDVLGYLAPLFSSLCYSVSVVLLRYRSRSEDSAAIAFFANTLPALYVLPVFFILPAATTEGIYPWFLLAGLFGVSFWSLTTLSYAGAPAARLAPLNYTQLIWAALIGFFLFNEAPHWQTWVGAGVIIASCLYVARRG